MGNCCVQKQKPIKPSMHLNAKYKTQNEWYKENQKLLIEIVTEAKQKKENLKIRNKRRFSVTKTVDDLPQSKGHRVQQANLQSIHANNIKSNAEFAFKRDLRRSARDLKGDQNIWDSISVVEILKPENLSIRNQEYKHILRRQFDLVHWDVLLRIIQVNNKSDSSKNFNLMKNQIVADYRVKFNSLFKKSNFKGKTRPYRQTSSPRTSSWTASSRWATWSSTTKSTSRIKCTPSASTRNSRNWLSTRSSSRRAWWPCWAK